MLPGAAARRAMVAAYARSWEDANTAAVAATGPLWIALGDSTAQGIGASEFDHGYVGQLLARLRDSGDERWRVVNLSVSGARLRDVLDRQLPALGELPRAELVTCAAGANDLLRTRWPQMARDLRELLERLPDGAVIATLPTGLRPRKAARANALIRAEAAPRGLRVADVHAHTGPPWAGKYWLDHFHPSDLGYRGWTDAFARAVGAPPGASGASSA
jgi:lysophospholipase L1-like esterase